MNKAQKLVRIVGLMTRRGGIRAGDLASRFELDARTLRRYLADLRDLEIPVVDEGRGEERIISIDPRWRRTGVQLSLAEVLSLHFGRTLFTFLDGTSFSEDLQGAIERLEPAISRAHSDLARQLDTKFVAVPEPSKDYSGIASEVIDEVVTALVYNSPVDARYRKVRGVDKRYLLHPYTLATYRQACTCSRSIPTRGWSRRSPSSGSPTSSGSGARSSPIPRAGAPTPTSRTPSGSSRVPPTTSRSRSRRTSRATSASGRGTPPRPTAPCPTGASSCASGSR